jgi:PAS domain S-box-containing protein
LRPQDVETRYRGFFELAPIAIAMCDHEGRLVLCNAAYERLLGYTLAELRELTLDRLVHPDDWPANREQLERVRAGPATTVTVENRYVRKDGSSVWVHKVVSVVPAEEDCPTLLLALVTEMTEQRRLDAAVRESEEITRRVADTVPGILYVYDLVQKRNVWGNREMVGLLGYTEPQIAAMSGRLLDALLHPDDMARYAAHHARLLELPDGVAADFEYRMRCANGDWLWLQSRDMVFRRDAAGRPRQIVGAALDITERRHIEERLRESERRLAAVLNNTTSAIFLMDERQHCVYMNAAAETLTGYSLAETAGRPLHDVVHHTHPDGRPYPLAECPIDQAFPTQNQMQGEETFVHRDGSFYPVAFTASPVRDDQGRPIGTVIEVRGIRAEKAAAEALRCSEEALREADRRKDHFLAILSHELRNPLAPIRTAAHLLSRPALAERDAAAAREIIQRQVRQMGLLLDDLLDVARITQGKLTLQPQWVPLASVIESAVEAGRPLLEKKRHRLTVTLPEGGVELHADALRLGQVFANLLTNAAKYTDPGGHVELVATVHGETLEVCVSDDGIGIPAEARDVLFRMFGQYAESGDRSEGGLGIGLAIVKGLVELHGGRVAVASEGAGRGSTFRVYLPLSGRPAHPAPPEQASTGPNPSLRILVVDDNRDAADSLGMLLAVSGHETRIAYDGASALALAEDYRPEIVLLDLGMPGMDGYEVARRLRARPWGHELLLVALTGWGQEDDRRRTRQAGFDHHFTKPVDPDELDRVLGEGHARARPLPTAHP